MRQRIERPCTSSIHCPAAGCTPPVRQPPPVTSGALLAAILMCIPLGSARAELPDDLELGAATGLSLCVPALDADCDGHGAYGRRFDIRYAEDDEDITPSLTTVYAVLGVTLVAPTTP